MWRDHETLQACLNELDLCRGLPDTAIAALAGTLLAIDVPPGGLVRGESGAGRGSVSLVLSGVVRLFSRGADGRQITLEFVGPGCVLGTPDLFRHPNDGVQAQAVTHVTAGIASSEAVRAVMQRHPRLMNSIMAQLGKRVVEIEQQLECFTSAGVNWRLLNMLTRIGELCGEPVPGGHRVRTRLTHAALACQIGARRETVTRALHALEDSGLVRREPSGWFIADAQARNPARAEIHVA
jgi:CRP-like cAMP-binding protein